jgi:hypothetical protein
MNSSLVYSVLSTLQFGAVQYEMPAAPSSKERKSDQALVTSTEVQRKNLVRNLGFSFLGDMMKRNLTGGY